MHPIRRGLTLAIGTAAVASLLTLAPPASATAAKPATPAIAASTVQDGATLLAARKCFFDSSHYTWVQVIRGSFHNTGEPNGWLHRIIANYMGTYTFDSSGNRQNNAETITNWEVRQQNASGSTNWGVGNNYSFTGGALGAYDETTYSSEYNYVHGTGVYVWEWLRRDDGATCSVKYLEY